MGSLKLKNGILVTDKGFEQRDCFISEGRICLAKEGKEAEKNLDVSGQYILPGFVDIHFHGYKLFDFALGQYCPETRSYDNSNSAFNNGYEVLCKTLAQFGTTGCYAATIGNTIENLKKAFAAMGRYMEKQKQGLSGTRIFGGLLEGSFINPAMCGAQNPEFSLKPSLEIFDSLEATETIRLTLVSADAGEGSVELTEYLTKKGIIVATGHTNATCKQVEDAIKAGLKYCIHFTNGPTGGSYKPFNGGGTIEAVLKHDELYAEQILDGCHVNPAYIRDIIKRKGVGKIIGVTDCMWAAGSDVKQFDLAGTKGEVSPDGRFIRVVGKPNTLCSSNLTMNRAFENMLNWLTSTIVGIWNREHKAMDFEAAVATATKICSSNACNLTGLAEDGFGQIADGAKADLCVLDIAGSDGNYQVEVEHTIVDGGIVYSKS